MKRKWTALFLALLALPVLALGAGLIAEEQTKPYKDEDLNSAYDPAAAIRVDLGLQENGYLITRGGTYVLTGTLNGPLTVQAGEDDLVRLVMDNADIANPDGPAVYGRQAGKVILTLAEGSVNSVSDGADYPLDEEGANAAVYIQADLTVNGSGSLTVTGQTAHGILSNDDLLIMGGSLSVTSVRDGLRGKDSVVLLDGDIRIEAGSDGIVSTNTETGKGSVIINSGSFIIMAGRDGIQAAGSLSISEGTFDIRTGEGGTQVQAAVTEEETTPFGMPVQSDAVSSATRQGGVAPEQGLLSEGLPQEGMPRRGGWLEETEPADSEESSKGIKAVLSVTIQGGTFSLDTQDDAIHSNGDVTIAGGVHTILTGDDGVHADGNLILTGGDLTINGCYEGLEGKTVTITGGTITITASDDGINAASGTAQAGMGMRGGMAAQEGVWVAINGGTVRVTAGYDGIDSNGDITISGGTVDLSVQRAGGGNMAIDPSGAYTFTGGQVTTNDGSESGRNAMGGMPQDGQLMRPGKRH